MKVYLVNEVPLIDEGDIDADLYYDACRSTPAVFSSISKAMQFCQDEAMAYAKDNDLDISAISDRSDGVDVATEYGDYSWHVTETVVK